MCLAAPGKVISIDESNPDLKMAKVSFGGSMKDICIQWLPETKVGDYIMAHVGTALTIVDKEEAEETLRLFSKWADTLEEQDNLKENKQ